MAGICRRDIFLRKKKKCPHHRLKTVLCAHLRRKCEVDCAVQGGGLDLNRLQTFMPQEIYYIYIFAFLVCVQKAGNPTMYSLASSNELLLSDPFE